MSSTSTPYPSAPTVHWEACPIETTLGSLGRKWTFPILRDIAFFPKAGFGLIRRRNPRLRQRTLSNRLRELTAEDLIRKVVPPDDGRHPYYELTAKGLEVWPILASLFQFGIRQHAQTVFADGRPRDLSEVYPHDAQLMLGNLATFARSAGGPSGVSSPSPRQDPPTAPKSARR